MEQWENFTGPAWPVLYEAMADDTREVARLSQANLARLKESIKTFRALEEKKFLLRQNRRILLAHIRLFFSGILAVSPLSPALLLYLT